MRIPKVYKMSEDEFNRYVKKSEHNVQEELNSSVMEHLTRCRKEIMKRLKNVSIISTGNVLYYEDSN